MTVSGIIDLNILKILQDQTVLPDKNTKFDSLFSELLKLFFKKDELNPDSLIFLIEGIIPGFFPVQPEQNFVETPACSLKLSVQPEQKSILSDMLNQIYQHDLISQLQPQTDASSLPVESPQGFTEHLQCYRIINKIHLLPDSENFSAEERSVKLWIEIKNQSSFCNKLTGDMESLPLLRKQPVESLPEFVKSYGNFNEEIATIHSHQHITSSLSHNDIMSAKLDIIEKLSQFNNEPLKGYKDDSISIPRINISTNTDNVNHKIVEKIELPVTRLQELSDIMLKTLSSSRKAVTVQLEPPELGRILLRLSMDNEGVKAQIKVENPAVKEVLAGLIPEIKSNLQSSGVKINDFLLDLMKDRGEYGNLYNGQGQKRHNGNQKFFEYFV